ncbi:MAG: hypothetical protein OXD43_12305, partial [Bacteroidetes bacterium]|nr:hypothetical protein [Bacteroidota bacterium]
MAKSTRKFAIVVDFFADLCCPLFFRGSQKGLFFVLFLPVGALFWGAFRLDSSGIISGVKSHGLKDFSLEWFQICILFEQDTVGFILWKYGGHPVLVVE